MAPMEGLTDFTYRNAYEKTFGKGRITKYFTPFISPNKSENFLAREIRDIDRGHNKDTYTVAQVMTNEAKDFIWTAKMLYEKYGYTDSCLDRNLNILSYKCILKHLIKKTVKLFCVAKHS